MRGVNRGHRVWPSLLVACVLALGGLAEAIGPTLIPQVDEFIDAPRALFGRTRAEIERVLGVPPYPGVVIRYSPASALTSVAITAPTYRLPQGLGVGASRRAAPDHGGVRRSHRGWYLVDHRPDQSGNDQSAYSYFCLRLGDGMGGVRCRARRRFRRASVSDRSLSPPVLYRCFDASNSIVKILAGAPQARADGSDGNRE